MKLIYTYNDTDKNLIHTIEISASDYPVRQGTCEPVDDLIVTYLMTVHSQVTFETILKQLAPGWVLMDLPTILHHTPTYDSLVRSCNDLHTRHKFNALDIRVPKSLERFLLAVPKGQALFDQSTRPLSTCYHIEYEN